MNWFVLFKHTTLFVLVLITASCATMNLAAAHEPNSGGDLRPNSDVNCPYKISEYFDVINRYRLFYLTNIYMGIDF